MDKALSFAINLQFALLGFSCALAYHYPSLITFAGVVWIGINAAFCSYITWRRSR